VPVLASTYHLSSDETADHDTYGRTGNPTWRLLESALAQLESAASALTFGSGMAAITAVLRALFKPGSVLVVPTDGYYRLRRYASRFLVPLGIRVVEAISVEMCDAVGERSCGAGRDADESGA
jgi:cystathionine gamma-lyase